MMRNVLVQPKFASRSYPLFQIQLKCLQNKKENISRAVFNIFTVIYYRWYTLLALKYENSNDKNEITSDNIFFFFFRCLSGSDAVRVPYSP